jgi:tetratricopeptide (TPR) repeat protein
MARKAKARKIRPSPAKERARAKRLNDEAVRLFEQRKVEAAAKKIDEALRIEPANLKIISNKAAVELARGNFRDVVELADRVLRRNPDDARTAILKASAFQFLDRRDLAMQTLKALKHRTREVEEKIEEIDREEREFLAGHFGLPMHGG